MRRGIFCALIILLGLLSTIQGQGTFCGVAKNQPCNCPPFDPPTSFYEKCAQPEDIKIPNHAVNAPVTYLINDGTSQFYGNTNGDSLTVFDNLFFGATYEFSTCNRGGQPPFSGFETLIVLRDPFGNVLSANRDCNPSAPAKGFCSYIAYTHESSLFNRVYLSVYMVRVSQTSPQTFICNDVSQVHSNHAGIYADLLLDPSGQTRTNVACNAHLDCAKSVTIPFGGQIILSDFILSSSDLCGFPEVNLQVLIDGSYYDNDGFVDDCDSIGPHNVTISLYDLTCTTVLIMNAPPAIVDCEDFPFIVNPEKTHCAFESPCAIDPLQYLIPYWDNTPCDYNYYTVSFSESVPNNEILLNGEEVTIYFELTSRFGYTDTTSCTFAFIGLVPTQLVPFNDPSNLIHNGGIINYNTPYKLFYRDFLPFDTEARLLFYGFGDIDINDRLADDFYYPTYEYFDNVYPGYDNNRHGYVEFCVSDDSPFGGDPLPAGQYELILFVDFNFNSVNSARNTNGNSITENLISVGNPVVFLTNNPRNTNSCNDVFPILGRK